MEIFKQWMQTTSTANDPYEITVVLSSGSDVVACIKLCACNLDGENKFLWIQANN